MSKPIAVIHVIGGVLTHTYMAFHPWGVESISNTLRSCGASFYVEHLDRHNPREVTNESEAGDE